VWLGFEESFGAGRSRVGDVEAFKWRGKDEEDHHSRNFRRNIDVGRMRFNDCPRSGRRDVRRNVRGERESEVLPAISLVAGTSGTYDQFWPWIDSTLSCGPSLCNLMPIILNNGLWVSDFPNKYRRCHAMIARYQPALTYG